MLGIEDTDSLRRLLEELKSVAKGGKKEAVMMRMKARAAPPAPPKPAEAAAEAPAEAPVKDEAAELEATPDGEEVAEVSGDEAEVPADDEKSELLKLLQSLGIKK